jgi:hypothetical protein
MFDQLTHAERFALRDLLLDCMNTATAAIGLLHKLGVDNLAVYQMDMEFSSLFNSINPLAVA